MMASPTFEQALQWLRSGAIAPDAEADPRGVVGDEALNRRARLFRAVFSGPDGELVLHTILEATVFRSPVDHRLDGEAYLRFAQLRTGQNQVAATILAYLQHAEDLERKAANERDQNERADPLAGDGGSQRPADDDSGGWSDPYLAVR